MGKISKEVLGYISKVEADYKNESAYYNFGLTRFGPFLYGYTKWLHDSISKSGCKKVFFFSRDGYMMKKAFDRINGDDSIATEYVYFSRKSIRGALIHYTNNYEESLKYLSWQRYVSFGTILEYYGFSESERESISHQFKIKLDEYFPYESLKSNDELKNIYVSLNSQINKHSKDQDALLERYLSQIDMNGMCSIVDIGWHGTMQSNLEEYAKLKRLDLNVLGYYVGINPVKSVIGAVNGYIYNPNDLKMRKDMLCFFGICEKFFQSLEGSTTGYKLIKGVVVPDLTEYELAHDAESINCIKEWQDGALKFVDLACSGKFDVINVRDWALPLVRFGKQPTLADIRLFKKLYNVDGNREYYVAQKPLYKYKPGELKMVLSNSPWKTGFMKSVFIVPFPYFWIYRLLRK